MACRRIAAAAFLQIVLFTSGVGLMLALQARFWAVATALALAALWIGAAAAWQGRLRAPPMTETPRQAGREAAEARLLASLLDQTPAPLVTRDAGGALTARNRAARRLFRVDGPIPDPPATLVDAMQVPGASGRMTATVGEAARTYAVSTSDVLAADGPLRLAVLLDIEPEVRAAEAAALRELMQVLGHEILNGLTPVASLAATAHDLIEEASQASLAEAREALALLRRRAEGIARFAEGYRALARLPPPSLSPTSLASLVDEAAQVFRSRWSRLDVNLLAVPPRPDVHLDLDRDMIIQALLNLLANAVEAAQAGEGSPRVELIGSAQDGRVALTVRDSGPGVSEEARRHIFTPFFTTRPEGTGVGLSLARQVARAHGGDLVLRPCEQGRGAAFELQLGG